MSNPRQPQDPASTGRDGSSAFTIAALVLGVIAVGQVAAVAWFVGSYEIEPADGQKADLVDDLRSDSGSNGPSLQSAIHQTHPVAQLPTIEPAGLIPAAASPRGALDAGTGGVAAVAISNKSALYFLDQGMALRAKGDMQGALVHFNSAASLEKDHPRIFYEFATTYEEMQLPKKAIRFWEMIHQMGAVRAGDYFTLAAFRLKDGISNPPGTEFQLPDIAVEPPVVPEASGAGVEPGGSKKKFLSIGSAIAEPDESVVEGERVVLNVLIQATPGMVINPSYVHVRVDLYDNVNGSSVDLTLREPEKRWVTQPVDWNEQAEELLEVTYIMPPQTDQEQLDFGHRSYHGYVAKVYYRDELQDVVAEPMDLAAATNAGTDALRSKLP